MSLTIELLEAEALQLSAAERARLIERLIVSLDADPEVEQTWAAEVERRNAEIEKKQWRYCLAVKLWPSYGPSLDEVLAASGR